MCMMQKTQFPQVLMSLGCQQNSKPEVGQRRHTDGQTDNQPHLDRGQ